MKWSSGVLSMCYSLLVAGFAFADGQPLTPVPEHPQGHVYDVHAAPAVPLFTRVKYKDLDDMAPCAQPKIVLVKNPCADPCNTCETDCVAIQICVPACGCELVSCRRNGDRIRYDYGEYSVDIRIKKGYIEVEYED